MMFVNNAAKINPGINPFPKCNVFELEICSDLINYLDRFYELRQPYLVH